MAMSITTRHMYTLLHLKALIDHLKTMEQNTFTRREREVVQESLQRAYEWAESLLPPDLLRSYLLKEQQREGDLNASQ